MSTALKLAVNLLGDDTFTLEPVGGAYLPDAIARALDWLRANNQDWCYLSFNGTRFPVYLDPARAASCLFHALRRQV